MNRNIRCPIAARRIDTIFRFAALVELPYATQAVMCHIEVIVVIDRQAIGPEAA